ncbi:hypothetical protein KBD45_00770 [Candidatus Dojkabacteria bacterium]|nr:hypothetical protein [Candidatus Dojkabacteria bacterium]
MTEAIITPANITPEEREHMRAYAAAIIGKTPTKGSNALDSIFRRAELDPTRVLLKTSRMSSEGYVNGLRICNQRKVATGTNDISLVDPTIAATFGEPTVPRICYEYCPFGSMQHAGVEGNRRIHCSKHLESVQQVLAITDGEDIEKTQNRRFLRAPNIAYLAKALDVDREYIINSRIFDRYHFYQRDPDYLNAASYATKLLHANLVDSLDDYDDFADMLYQYGIVSAYGDIKINIREDVVNRTVNIPLNLIEPLTKLSSGANLERFNYNWNCFTPIKRVMSAIHTRTRNVLDENQDSDFRFSQAVSALYVMERSWVWVEGNHSRCMNYFNVLLEKIGVEPIPHGVIDFAAHLFDFEGFEKYMRYVIDLEH